MRVGAPAKDSVVVDALADAGIAGPAVAVVGDVVEEYALGGDSLAVLLVDLGNLLVLGVLLVVGDLVVELVGANPAAVALEVAGALGDVLEVPVVVGVLLETTVVVGPESAVLAVKGVLLRRDVVFSAVSCVTRVLLGVSVIMGGVLMVSGDLPLVMVGARAPTRVLLCAGAELVLSVFEGGLSEVLMSVEAPLDEVSVVVDAAAVVGIADTEVVVIGVEGVVGVETLLNNLVGDLLMVKVLGMLLLLGVLLVVGDLAGVDFAAVLLGEADGLGDALEMPVAAGALVVVHVLLEATVAVGPEPAVLADVGVWLGVSVAVDDLAVLLGLDVVCVLLWVT